MKLFFYIVLLSYLFSERGDIHSFELIEFKTVEQVQSEINQEIGNQWIDFLTVYVVSLYIIFIGLVKINSPVYGDKEKES